MHTNIHNIYILAYTFTYIHIVIYIYTYMLYNITSMYIVHILESERNTVYLHDIGFVHIAIDSSAEIFNEI